jgi:putative flippase GtrA
MFLKFLVVGGAGFVIDASINYGLIQAGVDGKIARVPAIASAMLFTWLANRQFTYATAEKRSLKEALRYMAVAAVMACFNYAIYVVLLKFGVWSVAAVTIATLCQTVVSFHAYRRIVFTR